MVQEPSRKTHLYETYVTNDIECLSRFWISQYVECEKIIEYINCNEARDVS